MACQEASKAALSRPGKLPPAQPAYVLRGHSAQVHALQFVHANSRLLTGDADGWLVSWSVAYKRPVAVWKAHEAAILGLGAWGEDRIITHGRDNKLVVWKMGLADEAQMGKIVPLELSDSVQSSPKQPWLLHVLNVNTVNFCSFAMCFDGLMEAGTNGQLLENPGYTRPILILVPHALDSGGIDIFQLPSENRVSMINAEKHINTGMVMAFSIVAREARLQVAAAYESGHAIVYVQSDPGASWEKVYTAQPHSQPALSLAVSPSMDYFITTSADANIAKHPLPSAKSIWQSGMKPLKLVQSKHSGQQGLQIRSDGRVFSTAGWDARVRIYSAKTMNELAVLKWHKDGCYATAFASMEIYPVSEPTGDSDLSENTDKTDLDPRGSALTSVQQRRDQKAQTTHWIAAGSKDGKVSLWNIY